MIGMYDSGVGGLHILRAIRHVLPTIDITYLADTRVMPLGEHTNEQIQHELEVACDWFFTHKHCSLVLLACNTASVIAIRHLQQQYLPQKQYDTNVLGISIPLLEYMNEHHSDIKKMPGVVLSTKATHATRFYEHELRRGGFEGVAGYGSTRLAHAIEYADQACIDDELSDLKRWCHARWGRDPSYIVYACTHFPLAHASFATHFPHTLCVDNAMYVARRLAWYLQKHTQYEAGNSGLCTYYCSNDAPHMESRVRSLYNESIEVAKVSLGL